MSAEVDSSGVVDEMETSPADEASCRRLNFSQMSNASAHSDGSVHSGTNRSGPQLMIAVGDGRIHTPARLSKQLGELCPALASPNTRTPQMVHKITTALSSVELLTEQLQQQSQLLEEYKQQLDLERRQHSEEVT